SLNVLLRFAFQGKSCDEGKSFLTEWPIRILSRVSHPNPKKHLFTNLSHT
ncbi:hypothetical protein M9458_006457, partial [Cirrhinus mrigala]